MRKTILSLFALAAFTVTFAGTVITNSVESKWIYTGETNPIAGEPDCSQVRPKECARLHIYDEVLNKWVALPGDANAVFGERL